MQVNKRHGVESGMSSRPSSLRLYQSVHSFIPSLGESQSKYFRMDVASSQNPTGTVMNNFAKSTPDRIDEIKGTVLKEPGIPFVIREQVLKSSHERTSIISFHHTEGVSVFDLDAELT